MLIQQTQEGIKMSKGKMSKMMKHEKSESKAFEAKEEKGAKKKIPTSVSKLRAAFAKKGK
jgi:hypothetical protein